MSVLDKLTEGIVNRDLSQEGAALLSKWEKTGLLEGLGNDRTRNSMARLLENQAKELLRETSAMAAGDVEGFAAVAFPIVRRVFGGLIANDLVSVQPMSLPSGLIFFLDFTVSDETGSKLGMLSGESLYGGGAVASQITGGVSLTGLNAETSFYALNNGYSSPTGSGNVSVTAITSGTFGGTGDSLWATTGDKILRYDPDFTSGTTTAVIASVAISDLSQLNRDNLISISASQADTGAEQVRRLSQLSGSDNGLYQPGDEATNVLLVFASKDGSVSAVALSSSFCGATEELFWAIDDDFIAGGLWIGEGNVVLNRAFEEHGFLGHDADLAPQRIQLHFGNVIAIDEDAAGEGRIEAWQQFGERAFAGSRLADDAHELSGFN